MLYIIQPSQVSAILKCSAGVLPKSLLVVLLDRTALPPQLSNDGGKRLRICTLFTESDTYGKGLRVQASVKQLGNFKECSKGLPGIHNLASTATLVFVPLHHPWRGFWHTGSDRK